MQRLGDKTLRNVISADPSVASRGRIVGHRNDEPQYPQRGVTDEFEQVRCNIGNSCRCRSLGDAFDGAYLPVGALVYLGRDRDRILAAAVKGTF